MGSSLLHRLFYLTHPHIGACKPEPGRTSTRQFIGQAIDAQLGQMKQRIARVPRDKISLDRTASALVSALEFDRSSRDATSR